MNNLIDGKKISADVREQIKRETAELKKRGVTPGLATVLVGNNPASHVYVNSKHKACEEAGMQSFHNALPETATTAEVLKTVESLAQNPAVHGILVQLPLPRGVDAQKILDAIPAHKDVDGFHPTNVGRLLYAKNWNELIHPTSPLPIACTPFGVMMLLEKSGVELAGKNAVVLGRSMIVGKPMSMLLLARNATVTIAHSQTKNLEAVCRAADVLVVAIGVAKKVTRAFVKEGAVVIDVGMNRDEAGKLCGDVDFQAVAPSTSLITPVPGGVGPMTITMLLKNTLTLARASL